MLVRTRAGFAAFVVAVVAVAACSSDPSHASSERPSIQVFMNVSADPADVVHVTSILRRSPEARHVTFLNHAMAYREFRCLFRDEQSLVATTTATDLPESFRVTVDRRPDATRLRRRLSGVPGVASVEIPATHEQEQRLLRKIEKPLTRKQRQRLVRARDVMSRHSATSQCSRPR